MSQPHTSERHIVGEEQWPEGHVVDDIDGLLEIFECDSVSDLEDHFAGTLPEDPGDIFIYDEGESISIHARGGDDGVAMWSLPFPMSAADFDSYLFELGERMTIAKNLWELPDAEEWEAGDEERTVSVLAEFLHTTSEDLVAAVGAEWHTLDLDWVGDASCPSRYLQSGTSVIGLDNANAYLYRPSSTLGESAFDLDGVPYQQVSWVEDLWRDGGPTLEWFTSFVLGATSPGPAEPF